MRPHALWLGIIAVVAGLMAFATSAFTEIVQRPRSVTDPAFSCDMQQYKPMTGLVAAVQGNLLSVTWTGTDAAEVRTRYGMDNGQPLVRDVAVRKTGGQFATLSESLKPQYANK